MPPNQASEPAQKSPGNRNVPERSMFRAVGGQIVGVGGKAVLFVLLGRWISARLGPEGIALYGQIQNVVGLACAIGVQALQTGFQQGTAVRSKDPLEESRWNTTGLGLGLVATVLSSLAVWWGIHVGMVELPLEFHPWLPLLPAALPVAVFIGLFQGRALGHGQFQRASTWFLVSGFLQVAWLGGLILLLGRTGLFLGVVLQAAILVPLAFWWYRGLVLAWPPNIALRLRAWAPLVVVGLIPAMLGPVLSLSLRTLVLRDGWGAAGRWQEAVRLTDFSFALLFGAISPWILQRLSHPRNRNEATGIVWKSMALLALAALVLNLAPGSILSIAYGSGSIHDTSMLRIQSLAEVARAACGALQFALVARGQALAAAGLEVAGGAILLLAAHQFYPRWGAVGLGWASLLENAATGLLAWFVWRWLRSS